MKKIKKSKKEMTTADLRSTQSPFGFLLCSAVPALLLLASPFSGTGTPVYPEARRACALLLRGNPSEISFHITSHPMNARGESEAHLTKPNFLIANPELEFNLSRLEPIRSNFLIANK